MMKAMILRQCVDLRQSPTPLELVELPIPQPGPHEILLRVSACGVCHTELDEIEGRMTPARFPIVPGHEVVGTVERQGPGAGKHALGERVGVGWIFRSSGARDENLSPQFTATGRDANGGYAEYMTVHEDYAFPLPCGYTDVEAAPLLCAGAVGYRALNLTNLVDGDALGLTGFGGSAHLVLQMARQRFPRSPIFVFARDTRQRDFALELGADWAGDTAEHPPRALRAIIDTTPAWKPVVEALANLAPGGRLVINAIRKEANDQEELLRLSYHEHLWLEREIKTVANVTQFDLRDFLALAQRVPLQPTIATYPLEQANTALVELKLGHIQGAKVLVMD